MRFWERSGIVTAVARTPSGVRLYDRADAERMRTSMEGTGAQTLSASRDLTAAQMDAQYYVAGTADRQRALGGSEPGQLGP